MFNEGYLQWALDMCRSLRVCMSMPEPGEVWEQRILNEGSMCDAQPGAYLAFATEMVSSQSCISLHSLSPLELNILKTF